ncbi:hypothetical protein FRC12_008479 [Ceratobasidium sp. 428]|nr:hypothetical protein FRC12_008479 [Ceratobasidium sp. 428]
MPGPPRAAPVSGESNPEMLSCLLNWRDKTFSAVFGSSSMFGVAALIDDHDLERVSRCAPVPSIERLRRVLIKWHYVDSHLESMWNTLEEGGFTICKTPAETAAASEPDSGSQSTSRSKSTRKAPRRRNSATPRPPAQASSSRDGVQTPAGPATPPPTAPRGWWHDYLPERNYEYRQNVTMDDFRRMFAKPAAANVDQAGSSKRARSSTPVAPSPKRPRLNDSAGTRPTPAPEVPSSPDPLHFAPQPLARPVGRLIVPSQRPIPPSSPLHTQRTSASFTPSNRAPTFPRLQHPLPVRPHGLGFGFAPRNYERVALALSLARPRAPQPSSARPLVDRVRTNVYELRTYSGLPVARCRTNAYNFY